MPKSKKVTVQVNRRVSEDAKKILEEFEKEGITLDYIIRDYARLRRLERALWKRIDKKLDAVLYALEEKKVVVIKEPTKKKKKKKGLGKLLAWLLRRRS